MKTRYTVPIALALALALWGCGGDDDTSSGAGDDAFGNANTTTDPGGGTSNSAGGGGSTSTGTGTGTGTGGTGTGGAGPAVPGDHMGEPGMMMPGMKDPMKPMEMCPATKPDDGSVCKGHRMCTFDDLECRCEKEAWSCGTNDMTPDEDGGAMPP